MIPRIIHYCWFGPAGKPPAFLRCLESWKLYCPEFEIREWNEETARPYLQKFTKDALRKKQYAFAADAVRMEVLAQFGGVYLDTDMLLVKPLDALLDHGFFTGYEVAGRPAYGLFGSVSGHPIIQEMVEFYRQERFNQFSPPVITHQFKDVVTKERLGFNDYIYQAEYFYPMPYQDRSNNPQDYVQQKTIAVHLWDHSWKAASPDTISGLLQNLWVVAIDYFLYGYPWAYYKRYTRGFGRKLIHRITGKEK